MGHVDLPDPGIPQDSQSLASHVVFLVFDAYHGYMRTANLDHAIGSSGEDLLTTGEVAKILNTSRQHVVDLCDRGDLPFVTTGSHRRIRQADVDALRARTQRLTRDQQRSLWIGFATAGKVVADPAVVMEKARSNLADLRMKQPRGANRRWLDEWERLLDGTVDGVLDALASRTPRARELRQNSPFAGVLTEPERERVRSAFDATHRRSGS